MKQYEPLKQITNIKTGNMKKEESGCTKPCLNWCGNDNCKNSCENEKTGVEETKQTIETVLADPKVKEIALVNAKQIQEKTRGNWFTINQLMDKCKFPNYASAMDIMNLLILFGLGYRKEGAIKGTLKYKITFTKEDRLTLLQEELTEAQNNATRIQRQIDEISNK